MKKRGVIVLTFLLSIFLVMSAAEGANRQRDIKAIEYRDQLIQESVNGGIPVYDDPRVANDVWNVYTIRPSYADRYGPDLTQSNHPAMGGQILRRGSYDRFVSLIQERYKRAQQGLGTPFFMSRYPDNPVFATYYVIPQERQILRGSSVLVPGVMQNVDAPIYERYRPNYYWIDGDGEEEIYTPESNVFYGGKIVLDPSGKIQGGPDQGLRDYRDYDAKFS